MGHLSRYPIEPNIYDRGRYYEVKVQPHARRRVVVRRAMTISQARDARVALLAEHHERPHPSKHAKAPAVFDTAPRLCACVPEPIANGEDCLRCGRPIADVRLGVS